MPARIKQPGYLSDPVGQCRAVEVDPVTGKNLALPVERQVVEVFRHQQVGEQGRCGATARGRHRWRRGLGNDVARLAGEFRPNVADDLEVPGHVIEHFGNVFAKPGHHPAAIGAGAARAVGRLVHDLRAWQMIGQRLALRLLARADRRGVVGSGLASGLGLGIVLGSLRIGFVGRLRNRN